FWLWREQPLRESLSLLYVQLAEFCEAKYTLLTQHTDPDKSLPPLEGGPHKLVELITPRYKHFYNLFAPKKNQKNRRVGPVEVLGLLYQIHPPPPVQFYG
ncbi:FUSC family membrane protein, partial [Enterobacter hormaechei]